MDSFTTEILEFQQLELQLEQIQLEASLSTFVERAWHLVEPNRFVDNWHIGAICEHLQAVTDGEIPYLLITMPPRHSKSLIISTMWPCWEWVRYPQYRWVFASYAFSLSVRDSVKRRVILQSKWYQDRFSDRFFLLKEQNSKIRYENNKRGFMLASSVGGSNTGEGGERIVADDPHNVKKAESEEVRTDTVNWWNVVMSTRRNDEIVSARVVVQQRVHEGDVAGDALERGNLVHLNLPAEYVPQKRCHTTWRSRDGVQRHWQDPRTREGELLNPIRYNQQQIDRAKLDLGDYQYAAQFQQDPTPPSGSIIKASWLRYYGGPTGVPVPDWTKATNAFTPLLSLDCSFKEHKDTDYVAGTGWAMFGADIYLMPLVIHDRLSFTGTIDALAAYVGGRDLNGVEHKAMVPEIKIKLVEDKANGSAILDTMRHQIPGMIAYEPGNASKESRLEACSWRFRAGNIYLPHESLAPWVKEYVYELCAFPKAKKDDYADSTSMALLWIGGDPQEQGTPVGSEHESHFMKHGVSREGETSHSAWGAQEESRWGAVGGVVRSIWRRV
jgi:predicted phage terminase large subunit-like protein